ncbi:MAG: hypothetical protein GY943_27135 [Chloroflexi bacterium]|nr:hypothetical protein [Chloroflexota bacterium]
MSATDDPTFTSITLDGTDQSRSDTNDTWGQSLAESVWVMGGLIFCHSWPIGNSKLARGAILSKTTDCLANRKQRWTLKIGPISLS